MASLPLRLFGHVNGKFEVFNTRDHKVEKFSIITYTWGDKKQPYNCGIPGVNWNVKVSPQKLNDIKRLMIAANIQYLWVDCICLNQDDKNEIAAEIPRMYTYYKSAQKCYILMDMDVVWDPQEIVESLKFIDHVLENSKFDSRSTILLIILKSHADSVMLMISGRCFSCLGSQVDRNHDSPLVPMGGPETNDMVLPNGGLSG